MGSSVHPRYGVIGDKTFLWREAKFDLRISVVIQIIIAKLRTIDYVHYHYSSINK